MVCCHCNKNWIHLLLGDSKFRKVQWTNSCVTFWRCKCWEKWTHSPSKTVQAAAHTGNNSMDDLHESFEDWVISCPLWPIHTPTAMPCNDYLWRSLEDNTYKTIYTHKANLTNHRATYNWKFLDKNFRQYLIICSSGVQPVWEFEVFNTCFGM